MARFSQGKTMKKVYIAGPMSGLPNENRQAFNEEAAMLLEEGKIALNPATLPAGLTQAEYMDICFAMIRACDTVWFLKGWTKSAGAIAEYAYAKKISKELIFPQNEAPTSENLLKGL